MHRHIHLPLLVIAISALSIGAVGAQTAAPAPTPSQATIDKQFLEYAWADNQAEVQLALNAEKMGQSPAVIGYSRLIVVDGAALTNRLKPTVAQENVKVPAAMVAQEANKVAPKSGVDFDNAFLLSQADHLSDDVLRFQNEQSATKDEAIRKFAAETLPLLQQHLALAQAVQTWLQTAQARATPGTINAPAR